MSEGYVYIVDLMMEEINPSSPERGLRPLYKIGRAGDVQSRYRSLKAANHRIREVFSAQVNDMQLCEKHLHSRFNDVRLEREIFFLEEEHIEYAKKYLCLEDNWTIEEIKRQISIGAIKVIEPTPKVSNESPVCKLANEYISILSWCITGIPSPFRVEVLGVRHEIEIVLRKLTDSQLTGVELAQCAKDKYRDSLPQERALRSSP